MGVYQRISHSPNLRTVRGARAEPASQLRAEVMSCSMALATSVWSTRRAMSRSCRSGLTAAG
jgi:hypothetical protein